jgi:hypothetical protein
MQVGGGHAIFVHPHVPFEHVQVLQSIIFVSPSTHTGGGGGGGGGGHALSVQTHPLSRQEQVLQPSNFVSPEEQHAFAVQTQISPRHLQKLHPSAAGADPVPVHGSPLSTGPTGGAASGATQAISVQPQIPTEQVQLLHPSTDGAVPLPVHWLPGLTPCVLEPASKLPPQAEASPNASAPTVEASRV